MSIPTTDVDTRSVHGYYIRPLKYISSAHVLPHLTDYTLPSQAKRHTARHNKDRHCSARIIAANVGCQTVGILRGSDNCTAVTAFITRYNLVYTAATSYPIILQ